jgi:hypothetical protein
MCDCWATSTIVAEHGATAQMNKKLMMGFCMVQVYPKDTGLKCTFTAWAPVCEYILNQLTVPATSSWRQNGICIALQ